MRYGRSIGLVACVSGDKRVRARRNRNIRTGARSGCAPTAPQFDPNKPGGRGQQAPLTPEYQAKLDEILANRARGSLEGNFTVTCLPTGMPRMMIVYETMDIIVLPEMTYIRMTLMNELRRIHTDGRTWPEKLTPTFVGHLDRAVVDEDGDGRYDTLEVETRGMKGPRTFEGTPGIPLHSDNQTIVKERIYLDKSDPRSAARRYHGDRQRADAAVDRFEEIPARQEALLVGVLLQRGQPAGPASARRTTWSAPKES